MNNQNKFGLILILIIISLPSINSLSASEYDMVDSEDDVMKISWDSNGINGSFIFVSDKPNLDIIGSNYSLDNNMDAHISLIVKGVIETQANSYYQISVIDLENSLHIETWYGKGWASASENSYSGFEYYDGTKSGIKTGVGNVTASINKGTLDLILSKTITFGSEEVLNVTYPSVSSSNWEWHLKSWEGNDSLAQSGNWFFDYGPNSDNKYTGILNPVASSFGFELISLLVTLFLIYKIKRIRK